VPGKRVYQLLGEIGAGGGLDRGLRTCDQGISNTFEEEGVGWDGVRQVNLNDFVDELLSRTGSALNVLV